MGIRNLGRCPCPRCLLPLDHMRNMGMCEDMMERESLAHVDDMGWHRRVGDAREAIYVENSAVDGTAVETLLKGDSLVPMAVSVCLVM